VEVGTVIVPAGAFFGCVIRPHELRKHLAGGRFRDPEIAIKKEIAQSFSFEISVARFDVRNFMVVLSSMSHPSMGIVIPFSSTDHSNDAESSAAIRDDVVVHQQRANALE
jgi:hypothetical protein